MMPATLLYMLSVLYWTAAFPSSETAETCTHHPEAANLQKSWPVLAAVKVPPMDDATLRLSLSHKNHTHTNLTLAYRNKVNEALLVEVVVESEELQTKTSLMALLIPETWSILRLNLHKTKFTVVVFGTSRFHNYTSRAEVDFLHHLVVDTVTSSSEPKQLVDVDLKCLYKHGDGPGESGKVHRVTEESSSGQGTPAWPFFIVFFLLLIVCLLFLAWRYQHNQIKLRRRLQAQVEAAMKRNSERRSQRGSSGASGSQEAREEGEGVRLSERVQYSTIMVSYDGPCTTDDELTTPTPPARPVSTSPKTTPATVWS